MVTNDQIKQAIVNLIEKDLIDKRGGTLRELSTRLTLEDRGNDWLLVHTESEVPRRFKIKIEVL